MAVTVTRSGARSGEITFATNLEPELVFDYLADFGKHQEWSDELVAMAPMSGGAAAAGATYRVVDAAHPDSPQKVPTFAEITALERPRLIEWRLWTEPARGPRAMRSRWAFEIAGEGAGSRVTQRFSFEPPDIWSRLSLRVANAIGDALMGGAGMSPNSIVRRAERLQHVMDVRSAVNRL
ncbi:MAG TPA: SRPBCC family protein [Dehalococcoidia bacterium]|nr:SRPBCC family protein [Dehalococcoidia bacterium]